MVNIPFSTTFTLSKLYPVHLLLSFWKPREFISKTRHIKTTFTQSCSSRSSTVEDPVEENSWRNSVAADRGHASEPRLPLALRIMACFSDHQQWSLLHFSAIFSSFFCGQTKGFSISDFVSSSLPPPFLFFVLFSLCLSLILIKECPFFSREEPQYTKGD